MLHMQFGDFLKFMFVVTPMPALLHVQSGDLLLKCMLGVTPNASLRVQFGGFFLTLFGASPVHAPLPAPSTAATPPPGFPSHPPGRRTGPAANKAPQSVNTAFARRGRPIRVARLLYPALRGQAPAAVAPARWPC